jgi:CheY-like chemotaxis protein
VAQPDCGYRYLRGENAPGPRNTPELVWPPDLLGFGSAGEALEALQRGECAVDLLLTDVVLPGTLRGYDLARAVLAARPDLPVFYVSGFTYDALVHAGQLGPGVNLLEKPFAPEALAATVRTHSDKARGSG